VGPVVVTFFRGRWCPYCVGELEAWGEVYERVRARGGLVVGVSPQTARQNGFTAEAHGVRFPLLSDAGCRVADEWGLVWEVPEPFRRYLRSILVNVPYVNGDGSWRLPVPGTFAVGRDGVVRWGQGYADWRVRPEPEEVLEWI
jgi:peroxiredoxin